MRDSEVRRFEMCVRVDVFGQEHAADFPADTRGGILFQLVRTCIAQAQALIGKQDASKRAQRQHASNKAALRAVLIAILKKFSDTARGMDFDLPGTAAQFRMPPKIDIRLISAARAFLAAATPLKDEFIKNELPADFLDQLQTALDNFEEVTGEQARHAEQKVRATAGLKDVLTRAVRAVQQLGPIVRNKYADAPETRAAWLSVSRVERPPQRKEKQSKPAATPQTNA